MILTCPSQVSRMDVLYKIPLNLYEETDLSKESAKDNLTCWLLEKLLLNVITFIFKKQWPFKGSAFLPHPMQIDVFSWM